MTTIFINFRSGDGDWAAKLVKESLTRRFGKDTVFLDSDSIPLAARYPDILTERARTCDVMLALVGPRWLSGTGPDGRPLLFADGDWVRREIATALAAGRPVATVLLNGAPRLIAEDLPLEIRELAYHQDIRLDKERYDIDIARLEKELMKITPGFTPEPTAGSITGKSEVEIDEGEHLNVLGARMPVTGRDVRFDSSLKMKKGKDVTYTALEIGEPDPKKAAPA
jgi:hypothetical protein